MGFGRLTNDQGEFGTEDGGQQLGRRNWSLEQRARDLIRVVHEQMHRTVDVEVEELFCTQNEVVQFEVDDVRSRCVWMAPNAGPKRGRRKVVVRYEARSHEGLSRCWLLSARLPSHDGTTDPDLKGRGLR